MPWTVKSELESGSVTLPPNQMVLRLNGHPGESSDGVGLDAAVADAMQKVEADEAVAGYRLARTQFADAQAKVAAAQAEAKAAAASREVLRLKPTATFAEDLRKADARQSAATEDLARATADAEAIGETMAELYGRAAEVVAKAGIAARAFRVVHLQAERIELLKKLTAGGGPLLDALAANVAASYALAENVDGVRDRAVQRALGARPKAPAR